ncbi:MAG: hypothetical protein ACFFCQ_01780 [Promethearchaeota archaeon]
MCSINLHAYNLHPTCYTIHGIYTDVASGISFEKRIEFFTLLDEIL